MSRLKNASITVNVSSKGWSKVNVHIVQGARKELKPKGVILYRGKSQLDGKPIVCIATGLRHKSKNPKTGPRAIQTYILTSRESPIDARQSGADQAICGDCPHRSGSCYVNVATGPTAVWKAYQAGGYPLYNHKRHARYFKGRYVRLGTYGDPAAVPLRVWERLCGLAGSWTGYTHQWRTCDAGYAQFCMASCDTSEQRAAALRMGWRTYRVRLEGEPLLKGEFICPASKEADNRLTCQECRACDGRTNSPFAATPAILWHGSMIANGWAWKQYQAALAKLKAEDERRGRIPLL